MREQVRLKMKEEGKHDVNRIGEISSKAPKKRSGRAFGVVARLLNPKQDLTPGGQSRDGR